MSMNNVMIDLETLGNGANGVFQILAAVLFDPLTGETFESFYRNLDIQDQVNRGREIDPATVQWWFQQGEEARMELIKEGEPLWKVLNDFESFLPDNCVVWSRGIDFDIPKLESAYGSADSCPWKYYHKMDVRTVLRMAYGKFDPKQVEFEGVKHNALDDCYHQVKLVHLAYQALGLCHDE